MTTVVSYRKDGWVETEKIRGTTLPGDECRACNPDCRGTLQDCEQCVGAADAEN